MPEPICGAENPEYPGEYVCVFPSGHRPIGEDGWDHGNPEVGVWWNMPEIGADEALLIALGEAQTANMHARPCQVCSALLAMSEAARVGVEGALAGTIGERTLAEILTEAGYPTGRRAVQNHRREDHTP